MSDKCTKSTTLVVSGVAITRFYGLWVFMLKSYGLWVFGLKSYGLWVARPPQNPPLTKRVYFLAKNDLSFQP